MLSWLIRSFTGHGTTKAGVGFFVEPDECLDHGCCIHDVPSIFRLPNTGVGSEVYRQPSTAKEIGAVLHAMEYCPMFAIRYGGRDTEIISKIKASGVPDACIIHD